MIVEFDEEAIKYLEKLPLNIRKRIYEKIIYSAKNPYNYFKRLVGRTDYTLRIGDYRVIADIDSKIRVTLIGHRKNVYN